MKLFNPYINLVLKNVLYVEQAVQKNKIIASVVLMV